MGRRKQVLSRKGAQHHLPQFTLSEDFSKTTNTPTQKVSDKQVVAEASLDNDNDGTSLPGDQETYVSSDNEDDKVDYEQDNEIRKKISKFFF